MKEMLKKMARGVGGVFESFIPDEETIRRVVEREVGKALLEKDTRLR